MMRRISALGDKEIILILSIAVDPELYCIRAAAMIHKYSMNYTPLFSTTFIIFSGNQ